MAPVVYRRSRSFKIRSRSRLGIVTEVSFVSGEGSDWSMELQSYRICAKPHLAKL